jgi:hypothetical protein
MSQPAWKQSIRASGALTVAALLAVILSTGSCTKQRNTAQSTERRTFGSPEEAESVLLKAANSGDQGTLIAIFGPDSRAVLFTGDAATDKARLNDFVTAYNQMHRWSRIKAGGQVLYVGADNDPFPIPLGQDSSGRWYFDTAAGKDEILARRIGKNELTAMDASRALAGAERQYFQERHDGETQYAQKLVSDPGKHNGLIWLASDGQASGPLAGIGDFAKILASSPGGTDPEFNGYRYRILNKGAKDFIVNGKMTGGYAILAYPAEYRKSGITSFLIGDTGVLYQKDLGEHTAEMAAGMTNYNPADGWTPVDVSTGNASRAQPLSRQ